MNALYSYYDDYEDEADESQTETRFVLCYCEGKCPFEDDKGLCRISSPGGKCFAAISYEIEETGEEIVTKTYGCIDDEQMAQLQCKGALVPHLNKKNIQCCDDGDFCNRNPYQFEPTITSENKLPIIIITSCCVLTILTFLLFLFALYLKFRKRNLVDVINKIEECNSKKSQSHGGSSGESGSNYLTMVQRTISKQIDMEKVIGKGRYGEVRLGKWRGEKVAVKIFHSTQEKSWMRETEVYKTVLMRHENILGFVAADIKGSGSWTQLLLVTDYHSNGSLFDYLQKNTVGLDRLLFMSLGIAKGVNHLHTEIFGVPGKACIAHRDLTSKNILVKQDMECCIADFGLAVKFDSTTNKFDVPLTDRIGTKRYMAPEILSKMANLNDIDAYKMADIYALGLVLWEMSRRCNFMGEKSLPYEIPFNDLVSSDPSYEEMQHIVCTMKIRPEIPEIWQKNEKMKMMTKIIQEMWHDNPTVRLTALRVKKTMHKLITKTEESLNISNCSEIE
ncbi:unnamed protein product [Phyllotreta striolata]|uniref:Serine/threonine-protein kinase receptor n=1 Tax=Phyllotreta striolata TaxID=444603 RepID=A0A9N9XP27_PHYSR|nr:unnamed protein product [Phyllotreta striolata]